MTVDVTGKIDLSIVDSFGLPRLVDHKTVDALNAQQPPMDDQRMTYAVLKLLTDDVAYAGTMHNKLRKVRRSAQAKPPFYGRDEKHFTRAMLRSHYRHMDAILNEMVSTRLALLDESGDELDALEHAMLWPNPTKDCSWRCPFVVMCPMRDDGAVWVDFLGENFTRGIINTETEEV